MRCRVCKGKAVINLRQHNLALCKTHFIERFERETLRTIRRFKMFTRDEPIVVAVSGGKDSLSVLYLLNKHGYNVRGLYLDLGIQEGFAYSQMSKGKVMDFSTKNKIEIKVFEIKDDLGLTIPEMAEFRHEHRVCRICGTLKRYYLNKTAYEMGATTVVTGHNLDDEVATLLGNTLRWDISYLARQAPLLPSTHPKLLKRAKPFVFFTEKETAMYAILNNIPYIRDECPFSIGAKSILYKELLNKLEEVSPGTKLRFYKEYLKIHWDELSDFESVTLKECTLCSMPTILEVCSVCKMKESIKTKNPIRTQS